ncbi:unnamed protein product [Strongylus vulgaris]|uniref:Uncharacterized protein n=1 Tax=Strongylus vulgaris TaxID=40348 RepID=A0A3P7KCX1_STRVU|nr:unnamed protein product [Strongylus vulgaris]
MGDESAPKSHSHEAVNTHERARLMKRGHRPQRLRLPTTFHVPEPSPCTPCSVFSFDLPSSPVVITGRPKWAF